MATATRKKGLTTFGWLLVGGAAAFLLGSKERREKTMNVARDFAGKFASSSSGDQDAGASPS
jgi:hypothetical protein